MAYFRLRYNRQEIDVPRGELTVGRSDDCDVVVDHLLVSRRHARFVASESALFVEDLASRNGVQVNHAAIREKTQLRDGDVVTIGPQDFQVQKVTAAGADSTRRVAALHVDEEGHVAVPSAPRGIDASTVFGSRNSMIEEALRARDVEGAEFLVQSQLNALQAQVQAGKYAPEQLAAISGYALRLAALTEAAHWLESVFHLHRAAGRVLPGPAVDELYTLTRRLKYGYGSALRAYLASLAEQVPRMSPPERFAFQRLEGLARMLRVQ